MQGVPVEVRLPGQIEPDVLALAVPEDDDSALSDGRKILDDKLAGRLRQLAADGELRGELGRTIVLHTDGDLRARRIAAAGVGKATEVDADALRTAASSVARALQDVGGTIAWLLDETLPLPFEEQARAIVEGTLLGAYDPARWKSEPRRRRPLERIVLCTDDDPAIVDAGTRAATVAYWVNFARDLAN